MIIPKKINKSLQSSSTHRNVKINLEILKDFFVDSVYHFASLFWDIHICENWIMTVINDKIKNVF